MKECYKNKASIYETFKYKLTRQSEAFTYCYQKFEKKYDWFIMLDLDEYVYIIQDSLKNYLSNPIHYNCLLKIIFNILILYNNLIYPLYLQIIIYLTNIFYNLK